jgi:hypothetical protein
MGRPFPHVKNHGGGTAQVTTQGHRGTLFSDRFQISGNRGTQLLRAAAPMSKMTLVGAAIRSREDHSDEKITHHEVGWSVMSSGFYSQNGRSDGQTLRAQNKNHPISVFQ